MRAKPVKLLPIPSRFAHKATSQIANNRRSGFSTTTPDSTTTFFLEKLRNAAQADRLLRHEQRKTLHAALGLACALASRFRRNRAMFEKFVADEFWTANPKQAPKPADQQDALRFVLRWFCGKGTASSKRASRFYLALRVLGDYGIKAGPWMKVISAKGGVSGLQKLARSQETPKAATKKPDKAKDHKTEGALNIVGKVSPKGGTADLIFPLAFDIELAQVLQRLPVGAKGAISFEVQGDGLGNVIFRATGTVVN